MQKSEVYQQELSKLRDLFKDCEPEKAKLAEGLMQQAAYLYAENAELQERMMQTGMIRCHPKHPELQKPTEAGKQFLKNANTYALLMKTLTRMMADCEEPDDEGLDDYDDD